MTEKPEDHLKYIKDTKFKKCKTMQVQEKDDSPNEKSAGASDKKSKFKIFKEKGKLL